VAEILPATEVDAKHCVLNTRTNKTTELFALVNGVDKAFNNPLSVRNQNAVRTND
jgi:hypothetical protein